MTIFHFSDGYYLIACEVPQMYKITSLSHRELGHGCSRVSATWLFPVEKAEVLSSKNKWENDRGKESAEGD